MSQNNDLKAINILIKGYLSMSKGDKPSWDKLVQDNEDICIFTSNPANSVTPANKQALLDLIYLHNTAWQTTLTRRTTQMYKNLNIKPKPTPHLLDQ